MSENIQIESVEDMIPNASLERIEAFMKVIAQDSRQNASAIESLTKRSMKISRHLQLNDLSQSDNTISDVDDNETENDSYSDKRKLSSDNDASLSNESSVSKRAKKSHIHVANSRQTDRASSSKRSHKPVTLSKPNVRASSKKSHNEDSAGIKNESFKRVASGRQTVKARKSDPSSVGKLSVKSKIVRADVHVDADDDNNNSISSSPIIETRSVLSDAGMLEQLMGDGEDYAFEDEEPDNFRVLGSEPSPSWVPPKKSMNWYTKIADIELKDNEVQQIEQDFSHPSAEEHHFIPPKFPNTIWDAVKASPSDLYKQRICYKAQNLNYLAIKPLLSVLETLDPKDTSNINNITASIQLLCTSNLQLNRFRRSMSATCIKKELRKSILSKPVKHDSLFGDDFEKSTDQAIKEQTTTQKLLANKTGTSSNSRNYKASNYSSRPSTSYQSAPNYQTSSFKSSSNPSTRQKFRGRGRGRARGNYSGSQRRPNRNE